MEFLSSRPPRVCAPMPETLSPSPTERTYSLPFLLTVFYCFPSMHLLPLVIVFICVFICLVFSLMRQRYRESLQPCSPLSLAWCPVHSRFSTRIKWLDKSMLCVHACHMPLSRGVYLLDAHAYLCTILCVGIYSRYMHMYVCA